MKHGSLTLNNTGEELRDETQSCIAHHHGPSAGRTKACCQVTGDPLGEVLLAAMQVLAATSSHPSAENLTPSEWDASQEMQMRCTTLHKEPHTPVLPLSQEPSSLLMQARTPAATPASHETHPLEP